MSLKNSASSKGFPTDLFHPLVEHWFQAKYQSATEIQQQAWPVIAKGNHTLISAPTGSGKTLTAFLWALSQFISDQYNSGGVKVLYISPLKALNNDIQKNLLRPLQELSELAKSHWHEDYEFPTIRVMTRSGDTDQATRQAMIRRPPEILITTPESLNLLLSSKSGISILGQLEVVILDEIHSVLGEKRGVHLMSAVERLTFLSGEFQRIALSATVNPLRLAADFIGGQRLMSFDGEEGCYEPRLVTVLESKADKLYDIHVEYPDSIANRPNNITLWQALASEIHQKLIHNRSTLVFVNSRILCEKIAHHINEVAASTIVYAHHGSLSKELRLAVENRLKAGDLKGIVATKTLEMGIDIGHLDEVILIQSVDSIASAKQRIGRAGHGVGEVSRATFYPTHPLDFIETAVMIDAIKEGDLEPVKTILNPLDVLSQIIISCCATESWELAELFSVIKTTYGYRDLPRKQFDLVIQMLTGFYGNQRVRELEAKITYEESTKRISARKSAVLTLYRSGGTIPDRGYFQLRHADSSARIGELDEEFVWEAKIGQIFTLGTQLWQIQKITHNDVFVLPAKSAEMAPPFWIAEDMQRNHYFSLKMADLLEKCSGFAKNEPLGAMLEKETSMSKEATTELADFLLRQKEHTHSALPHRHHILIEKVNSMLGSFEGCQIIIHTFWGAKVNRPLGVALEAAWIREFGDPIEIYVSNENLVLQLAQQIDFVDILSVVKPEEIQLLLRSHLESSGFFGARFREASGRALLINKGKFNERRPLWMTRLQSQKLYNKVIQFSDFPILLETWRSCLQDEFDIEGLVARLTELEQGQIQISHCSTATASPMAQQVAWEQINLYMYADDVAKVSQQSNLSQSLIDEILLNDDLRPKLKPSVVTLFERKRQRLEKGYSPTKENDITEWIKERLILSEVEWQMLRETILATVEISRGTEKSSKGLITAEQLNIYRNQLHTFAFDGVNYYCHIDLKPKIQQLLLTQQAEQIHLFAQWLSFYGPVSLADICKKIPLPKHRVETLLLELQEEQRIVSGYLIQQQEEQAELLYCDVDNYEILLRLNRRLEEQIETQAITALPAFLFSWQTRFQNQEPENQLQILYETLLILRAYPAPAVMWETDFLPSRIKIYQQQNLDLLWPQSNLLWKGQHKNQIAFYLSDEIEDLPTPSKNNEGMKEIFADPSSKYDSQTLMHRMSQGPQAQGKKMEQLWDWVWQGLISNDSIQSLRKGIEKNFKFDSSSHINNSSFGSRLSRTAMRRQFQDWKQTEHFPGNWYLLPKKSKDRDELVLLESEKQRARIVMERYGLVFKELLSHEEKQLQWSSLFRAFRLLELSGEIVSGHFFDYIPGLQFMSPEALHLFKQREFKNHTFFINAIDPISLCGCGFSSSVEESEKPLLLPKRIGSNHLVYAQGELVLTSYSNGSKLQFYFPPDNVSLKASIGFFRHLLTRDAQPISQLTIKTINDEPSRSSHYLSFFESHFNVMKSHNSVTLLSCLD